MPSAASKIFDGFRSRWSRASFVRVLETLGKSLDDPGAAWMALAARRNWRDGSSRSIGHRDRRRTLRSGCRADEPGKQTAKTRCRSMAQGCACDIRIDQCAIGPGLARRTMDEGGARSDGSGGEPDRVGELAAYLVKALTRLPPSCRVGTSPPLARSTRARSAPPK